MRKVQIEKTENYKIIKFVTDYTLIPGGVQLDRNSDLSQIPMAVELFKIPLIESIFITANFIAVEGNDPLELEKKSEEIRNLISDELLENPRVYRSTEKKQIFPIYAEMTPNPSVMKFVSTKMILDGFLEVEKNQRNPEIPLAEEIFEQFDFLEKVFISDNFVAVTKNQDHPWHEVMNAVRSLIAEYLQNNGIVAKIPPQKHESPVQKIIDREYSEDEKIIADILAQHIAPAVENDGGKISLIDYDQSTKTAKMLLQGACAGCPSANATLKNGIENLLKQFVPELVEKVEAIK